MAVCIEAKCVYFCCLAWSLQQSGFASHGSAQTMRISLSGRRGNVRCNSAHRNAVHVPKRRESRYSGSNKFRIALAYAGGRPSTEPQPWAGRSNCSLSAASARASATRAKGKKAAGIASSQGRRWRHDAVLAWEAKVVAARLAR